MRDERLPASQSLLPVLLSVIALGGVQRANLVVIHFFWYTATGKIFLGNGHLRSVYQKKYVEIGIWITFGGSVIHALVLWITGGNPSVHIYGRLRSCDFSSGDASDYQTSYSVIALLAVQDDKCNMAPYVRYIVRTAPIVLQCKVDQNFYDTLRTVYRTYGSNSVAVQGSPKVLLSYTYGFFVRKHQ